MAEQELVERIAQYMPNNNMVLAKNLANLFDEYTQNGQPAANMVDGMDFDQLIGDSHLGYYEKKSRLINALRDAGYFSETEMRTSEGLRIREESRLLDKSDKEKRDEELIVEQEEANSRFNHALEKIAQDKPLENLLCEVLPEMKRFNETLDMILSSEYSNGMIVSGPAGISKTHRIWSELKARGIPFALYNAHATSLGLFELLHANKTGVVILDDLESILEDKKSIGILKAASFSANGVREVTWNSTAKVLQERGLPTRFVFSGKILIITNDEYKTRNASFQALLSRMPVFKLNFTLNSRKILIRSIITKQDMYGLPKEDKAKVLQFMEDRLDYSKAENYNLRTVIRAMEIYKLKGERGMDLIEDILGIDKKMRSFLMVEDKAKHLPSGKRVEVWKLATGHSVQSYYNLKNKYMQEKFSEEKILARELEEIEAAIKEVENGNR